MTPRYFYAAVPASVTNDPIGYAISIFGLLTCSLLAFGRLWSIISKLLDDGHSAQHPATLNRWNGLCLILCIMLLTAPDMFLSMMWHDVSPATRFDIARVRRLCQGLCALPMIAAFMLGTYGGPMIEAQLKREPIPVHLLLTRRKLAWVATLLGPIVFISLAIAFK